ncbi:hypothetical protein PC113_g8555 [Phytophthora cactorum]|uniref:ZSWIM1/3 RNaseH-like domain-containing protein n=1 Tax=Phytophthora cactorum TaxID=29920 RepID=A0A8T0ZC86_9STRA|nr:hypothetical protein PC113_g8555 [Phytophthora cactorum]
MLRPRTRERCKKYLRPLTRQTTSHPRMARMARIMKECHRRRQPWTTGETKRRTAKILVQALTTVLKRGRLLWMTALSSRAHWQDHNSPRRPQPCPKHKKSRLTDAKRARTVLEEFCDQNGGNSAELVICGERNVASVVTFQTAKMKRLFEAFPEVIMVDSTYNTNTNRYKLLSFVVYDVFGKGQYVHHALVESDEMTSVADLELASLPLQISKFAFNLVSGQHELATGPNANYDVDLDNPGKAAMTAPTTGNVYRVGTLCNCISIQTCLLPYHMTEDVDLLAFWPGYGYATFDQLSGASKIFENLLKIPRAAAKSEYKSYVEATNLGTSRVPGDMLEGHQLFDFRENLWLHTTSILVSLLALRDEYPGLGVISPSFHDVCLLEQKRRTAGGLGAGNPEYARVIGAMNVGAHWVVFFINRKNKVCKTFDPLQSNVNYKTVEKRVRSVMEPILDLKDQVHFERIEWCTQQD